jgi:hypothetical protein
MMAARVSAPGLAVGHDGNNCLRVCRPGVEPDFVPGEVGLRETGRIVEAVRLAGRPADDPEQRRTLPNRVGQFRVVAGRALLLEQPRSIGRPGSGRRVWAPAICATRNAPQNPGPIALFAPSLVIRVTVGPHGL